MIHTSMSFTVRSRLHALSSVGERASRSASSFADAPLLRAGGL